MVTPPLQTAPLLLLLAVLACLPDEAQAVTGNTSEVLTIVAIVLGCSVAVGGASVIAWLCWKHGKTEQTVTPKPTPKPAPSPVPPHNQPMMLVAQSPMPGMPGMQGFMVPAGGMMMGYPGGMAPGTALYQVPMSTPQPAVTHDNTAVEDLEANK